MAIIYNAELSPSKIELLREWLPQQPWVGGDGAAVERVDSYRFDDPAGEVGIEVLLMQAPGGEILQVPLSYRPAPLDGGEHALIATMKHSVLGDRWVYDATADPVAVAAFVHTITTGNNEAEQFLVEGDSRQKLEQTAHVTGSGVATNGAEPPARSTALDPKTDDAVTTVVAGDVSLSVRRIVEATGTTGLEALPTLTLTGTWVGRDEPVLLAWVTVD